MTFISVAWSNHSPPVCTNKCIHIYIHILTFLIQRIYEALLKSSTVQSLQQAEVSLVQCTCVNMVHLGVVDNLWDLSILHWGAVIVSRGAKEEKRRLGPHWWFLGHHPIPFCAVMGIWSLRSKNKFNNYFLSSQRMHKFPLTFKVAHAV